jgi:hypothetical protein
MKKLGIILFLILLTQLGIAQSEIDRLLAKAHAGDPKAQNQLGVRYLIGDGVEKDPKQAVEWYRKAARAGYPDAMFNLGAAYFNGAGVSIDDSAAFAFFSAAAHGGSSTGKDAVARMQTELTKPQLAQGYLLLGDMLSTTSDLPHDYLGARQAYESASDLMPIALIRLAGMELDGKGAPPNPENAKSDCMRAADMRYPAGACCLGILYEGNKLGPPDYNAARDWYLKAAKQGYAPGAYYLGDLYAKGKGVAADPITAFSWYYLAAAGDARAKAAFDDLSQKLSVTDQAKGAKLAQKWMADNHIYIPALHSR